MSERSSGDDRWYKSALCAQTDPEIFNRSNNAAKRICGACEVQPDCEKDYIETVANLAKDEREVQTFRAGLGSTQVRALGRRAAS
jgi:hypothetical protein